MASPVSIGDVLMLSQFAYRLAKALGPDRGKVPNAFRDVKNQLLAMGNALSFCWFQENEKPSATAASNRERCEKTEIDTKLAEMLSNCQTSLQRLEQLISKYSCLDTRDNQYPNDMRSLKPSAFQNAKRHWKKLLFLLEDSELETIRKDIAVQIEAINLAISGKIQSVFLCWLWCSSVESYCQSKYFRDPRHQIASWSDT